jgi:hypothetical protein
MTYSAHAVEEHRFGHGSVERRLAAILAADVAGYSRLMGADEEGTHLRLKSAFRPAGLSQNQRPRWPHRQEYRGCPAGGIPECPRGAAVCCRIQLGMIAIVLNSIATISIFANWPSLRAEATT